MELFDQIDALHKELQSLPMKAEDRQRLDKKFRLEFNYNSNHLEGNTLTYGETELLLIFGDTNGNHTMREYEEMKAHDAAYHLVEEWAKDAEHPLTEQRIKKLNEIILVEPFWKDAITPDGQATQRKIKIGEYKEHPNSVRLQNGEIFHYTSPVDTPIQMGELIDWYRREDGKLHPLELAALLHYRFVCIHPFDDGNGRVSRLLMNFVLLQNNFPPLVIKSNDKSEYLRALHQADAGDLGAFVAYIGKQLLWSLDISIKAAKGESIDEADDWQKKLRVLKKARTDKGEVKTPKSDQAVYEALHHTIKPFVMYLTEQLNEFDELFTHRSINIFNEFIGYPAENKQEIQFAIDSLGEVSFNQLSLNYVLHGFKDGLRAFDTSIVVKWEFTSISYKFFVNGKELSEKFYHQQFTQQEIELFTSECGRILYDYIELTMKKK